MKNLEEESMYHITLACLMLLPILHLPHISGCGALLRLLSGNSAAGGLGAACLCQQVMVQKRLDHQRQHLTRMGVGDSRQQALA